MTRYRTIDKARGGPGDRTGSRKKDRIKKGQEVGHRMLDSMQYRRRKDSMEDRRPSRGKDKR